MTMAKLTKRIAVVAAAALVAAAAVAAPQIKFDKTRHDFGNIHAGRGPVKAVYEFTNTGDEPLVIVSVTNGGCGCTKPSFSLEPVRPGQKGQVTITFDPRGRSGEFNREVKVKTNAKGKGARPKLQFSGVVVPK